MFLEVSRDDLKPGKAYLLATWPLNPPKGIDPAHVGAFFGPIEVNRFAIDTIGRKLPVVIMDRVGDHERIIAVLQVDEGRPDLGQHSWRVCATTIHNTPAPQFFERLSIYVEEG